MNESTYKIHFWHGFNLNLKKRLMLIGCVEENGDIFYRGTLDDFKKLYDSNFMLYKADVVWYIGVTHHSNFSSR